MKAHQIKAFLAVVETGSLKLAACQLHLTQPALSKSIKELENQLGVSLLVRSANGVTPTAYGERLLGYARLLDETARRARQDIECMRGESDSQVIVGITPVSSLLKSLVTSLNTFQLQCPDVTVRIQELRPVQLLERLRQGSLDFAITSQVPVMDSALEWQPITRIPNVVVVRKSHLLRQVRSLRQLLNSEWIYLDSPRDQNTYYYQMFAVNGLPLPAKIRECSSMTLVRRLMQSTDLVGLYSRESLEFDYIQEEFSVVPLVDNIPDSLISVVTPKREVMTSSALRLFDTILHDLRELYPEFT